MGGYKLHLYCSGLDNPDDLTVMLESGLAGTTSNWTRIQNEVSKSVRVCSYDRGGMGWSDPTPRSRDGIAISGELHDLLQRGGISGRLLLVGHSSGGIYVRAFRAQYPEQVAGLVLLDASHEDQFERAPDGMKHYTGILNAYSVLPWVARLGVIRLGPLCNLPADFPVDARENFHAVCSRTASWKAQQGEHAALLTAMAQVKAQSQMAKLDALPLAVVTAGNDPQNFVNWLELQNELADLSTNSKHIVRTNATHPGLLHDVDDAHASSAAINELANSIRAAPSKS
jgi:pimeloyl-ACP methyl ester carboxylesterase